MRKPFPSRVNWSAVWRHRWLFLDALNQIAYGSEADAVTAFTHVYGGSGSFCRRLYVAAREAICVERREPR